MPSLSRPACLLACVPFPLPDLSTPEAAAATSHRVRQARGTWFLLCLSVLSSPFVRLSVASSIIAHIYIIHTYACVCVCVCVYIDENSFNAPHVLGRLPLIPSASSPLCHLFCAHFCACCLLLLRLHFTWLCWLCCCVSLFILWSFLLCHSQSKSHASFSDSIFHISLATAAAASTQTNKRSFSLSHIYQHLHTRSAACRHCALALPFNQIKIKCVCQMMMYRKRVKTQRERERRKRRSVREVGSERRLGARNMSLSSHRITKKCNQLQQQ